MRSVTALLLLPSIAAANGFTAKVVGVADGDAITVLRENKPVKLRLHGVDCPERKQPFGQKAKQFTSKLVFGKVVKVEVKGKDRHGRTVAVVFVKTGETIDHHKGGRSKPAKFYKCLNDELVKAGLAWWHRRHAPKHPTLGRYETAARSARRGLWREPNPVAPWDWRRGKRSKSLGVLKGTKVGEVFGTAAVDVRNPITGNVRSKVFHWFTCKHANCKNCRVHFETVAQAKKAGYRPHRACLPSTPPTKTKRGADPSNCYEQCLRRSSMQAVSWEAIKAQCRSACKSR